MSCLLAFNLLKFGNIKTYILDITIALNDYKDAEFILPHSFLEAEGDCPAFYKHILSSYHP